MHKTSGLRKLRSNNLNTGCNRRGHVPLHLLGSLCFALLCAASHPSLAAPFSLTEQWQLLSPGIEVKELVVHPEALFPSRILFARLATARTRMRVLTAEAFGYKQLSAREVAIHSGASLTINANFFDDKGAPLGVVISQGVLQHRAHRSGRTLSGVFQLSDKGFFIIHRDSFSPRGVIEAVQAGPRLTIQSQPVPGVRDTLSTRRAGVCVTKTSDVIVFCVSSGLFTLDIPSLQTLLTSPAIGCVDTLNLDGGGSAQLFARGPEGDVSVEGIDRVPIFLGFFSTEPVGEATGGVTKIGETKMESLPLKATPSAN